MWRRWVLVLSAGALASAGVGAASPWAFVTEPFPPYTYADEQGRAAGPMVDVLQLVCQQLQRSCTVEVLPWRRALSMAERGQADGIFTLLDTPERRQRFHVTLPVLAVRYTLFARAGDSFSFNPREREALRGRTIAAYGPSGTSLVLDELTRGLAVQKVIEPDNPTALRKLLAGRYGEQGLVLMNEAVALNLIQHEATAGVQASGVVKNFAYSFGLVKGRVSAAEARAFDAALARLCHSGRSAAQIGHYGLSATPCIAPPDPGQVLPGK